MCKKKRAGSQKKGGGEGAARQISALRLGDALGKAWVIREPFGRGSGHRRKGGSTKAKKERERRNVASRQSTRVKGGKNIRMGGKTEGKCYFCFPEKESEPSSRRSWFYLGSKNVALR